MYALLNLEEIKNIYTFVEGELGKIPGRYSLKLAKWYMWRGRLKPNVDGAGH